MVVAAPLWHWWISVLLIGPAVLAVIAIAVGYFVKVVSPRYPKQ